MVQKLKALLFQNRSTKQTIVKNVFWLSFSQIASRLIRAIIIIYAARILGAAEYGVFSYALGLAGFFTLFADIGLSAILTRDISQKPTEAKQRFATSLAMKSVLLLFTALLVLFVAPFFSKIEEAVILLPFVAVLVIFDNLRDFSLAYFRGKEKMETEAFVMVVMNILIVIAGFLALSISTTSRSFMIAYVGSAGLGALICIFLMRREYAKVFSNFRPEFLKPTIQSAFPIAILGLLGIFMLNTDMIMLGWWRTAEEIGYYSAAQKIVQVLYTLPAILGSGIFPAISRLSGEGKHSKVSSLISKGVTATLALGFPIAIGGSVLSNQIISFVYGPEYAPASLAFIILILTTLIIFPGTLIGNYILAYERQKYTAKYVAIASLLNIILNAIFIPNFGIYGAASVTLIVQFFLNFFMFYEAKKANNFYTIKHISKILPAAIIMGIVAWSLSTIGMHVITSIAISALVYFALLFVMKEKLLKESLELIPALRRVSQWYERKK